MRRSKCNLSFTYVSISDYYDDVSPSATRSTVFPRHPVQVCNSSSVTTTPQLKPLLTSMTPLNQWSPVLCCALCLFHAVKIINHPPTQLQIILMLLTVVSVPQPGSVCRSFDEHCYLRLESLRRGLGTRSTIRDGIDYLCNTLV